MSLKKNVIANYLGQGWRALMGLAFVPLYIRYLGIEAYGLIGIFALLQAWLSLLDMGMKPALVREMARYTAGEHDAQSIRDLLRSIEIVGIAIAAAVALSIWLASGWLASDWLRADNLPAEQVAHAFVVMGAVIALRFIENIYVSSIVGLQRQVLQNTLTSFMATARGLGAIGVLVWVQPSIKAFFVWQGFTSLITVALFAGFVYRSLPPVPRPARFSRPALIGVWRFTAGMMVITFLSLLLTQVDKLILTRMLTLEAFGYYALAAATANALYMLVGPVTTAFYPRLTELVVKGDTIRLRATYHQAAQLVTVLMGAAATVLIVFCDKVLFLWTGDPVLTQKLAPLVAILAAGTLLNGLMWIPYHLQLAHGWTTLAIYTNIAAVGIIVPAFLWVVPEYGPIGAACVWLTLNAGYLMFEIYFMHRRLLTTEKWHWYCRDVAMPLFAAAGAAIIYRLATPDNPGRLVQLILLLLSSVLVLTTAALTAPFIRNQLFTYLPVNICARIQFFGKHSG